MATSIINTATLNNMLEKISSLKERREALETQIAAIDAELMDLIGGGLATSPAKSSPAKASTKPARSPGRPRKAKAAKKPAKKSGRKQGRPAGSTAKASTPKAKAPKAAAKKTPGSKRGRKRGETGRKILKALGTAGTDGLSVKELSEKLKIKPQNLYVWFNSTGRKVENLKKVGKARYALSA